MSSPSFSSLRSDSICHCIPLSSSTPSGTSSGAIGSSTGAVIVTTPAPEIEEFLRSGITREQFEGFLRFCFTEEEFKKFIRRGSTQKDFECILSLGITQEELKEFLSLGITRDEFERFLSLGFTQEEFIQFLRSGITQKEFKELLRFSITKEAFVKERKEDLYDCITNRLWNDVLEIYRKYKVFVQIAKIINSDETALHVAISESKTEVVEELLKIIDDHEVRKMTNNRNENPLHLAVLLGETKMCKLLVDKDPKLIAARNKDGETPLFLAAKHGKKGAFYALHPKCPIKENRYIKHDIFHCKRNDGSSILHITILGEYFDLAFLIIFWYPELITYKNERGQTALHLLAQNPLAFRSGTDLGLVEDFIYRCLIVESAKIDMPSDSEDEHYSENTFSVLRIYKICLDSLNARKKVIKAVVNWARKWKGIASNKDVEKQSSPVESTGSPQLSTMRNL